MSRSLVLARVGGSSLHESWIAGGGARDWDLHLAPYEPLRPGASAGCEVHDEVAGPKWTGLSAVLNGWDGWRDYDCIWLPDDDISTSQDTISRMFEAARGMRLDLFAPALDESSYYAHFSTMRNRSFHARKVGFVEIMVPGFSRRALEALLPTLDLTETGWGWGLDSVWPKLLDYENVGIIDGTPVVHTRPVGQFRDADLARRVLAESDAMLERHGCGQVHATFAVVDPDLRPLDLPPDRLLADVVRGWDYLVEDNPDVLPWMVEHQMTLSPCPEYPAAGTPARGPAGPCATPR